MGETLKQVQCGTSAAHDAARVAALSKLFRTYERPLIAYIQMKLPPQIASVTDAQDVLQDTMFQACRRVGDPIPSDEQGFAWLKTVAHHRMIDLVRIHNTLKNGGDGNHNGGVSEEVAAAGLSLWSLLQQAAMIQRTPSQSAAYREEARLLDDAILRLVPDHRSVIRWRFIECLSVKETAIRFGRSEGAVQMLSARALEALRLEMRSLGSSDSMHSPL